MGELAELLKLLEGKVIVSADISNEDLKGVDSFRLASEISAHLEGAQGIKLLDKELLKSVLANMNAEKRPTNVEEIVKNADFKPIAKDMHIRYAYEESRIEFVNSSPYDFADHFNNRFEKLKRIIATGRQLTVTNIENFSSYLSGREVSTIGMVYDKKITKNGHVLVTLEDQTGSINVLFAKPKKREGSFSRFSGDSSALYNMAMRIARDDVILIRGKLSKGLLIASAFSWPDIPVRPRKQSEDDFAIAMISDVHVGHKLFLEKQFSNMLRWLNGGIEYKKELAGKIKFAVFCGDIADGIGVYPSQEKELVINDIYAQYSLFFELLKGIPDYIEVFVLPGNHDAVRRADPQPELDRELARYNTGNVHLITNPSLLKLEDINLLAYHGESLDSIIRAVPGSSYARPEEAMVEILKRRHLSSIYGENPIVSSKDDTLTIEEVPDILLMGHIHKNGAVDYHGTLLVNSGTWQARTSFQIKQGHIPSPALLPVYETNTRRLNVLDFNKIT
ncbi:MAG: metallophosphoesterase [Candidatus Micrarchaeaceae archaeon]